MFDYFSDTISGIIILVYVFLVGTCLGSFASAVAHRISVSRSWIFSDDGGNAARSCCPYCNHQLRYYDLVPLLSWVLLLGKCRYCSVNVPALYPVIEIIGGVLAVFTLFLVNNIYELFLLFFFLPIVLSLMLLDYQKRIIPKLFLLVTFLFFVLFFYNLFKKFTLHL